MMSLSNRWITWTGWLIGVLWTVQAVWSAEPLSSPSAFDPEVDPTASAEVNAPVNQASFEGDVLTLRSGRELRGFLVIRETPAYYELEIMADQVLLRVPRNQVVSITYDEAAHRARNRSPKPPSRAPVLLEGNEISSELLRRLTQDISDPPFRIRRDDFMDAVTRLGARAGVKCVVDSFVADLDSDARRWSYALPEGGTLQMALQALEAAFPRIHIIYEDNVVRIVLRSQTQSDTTPTRHREPPLHSEASEPP